MTHRTLAGFGKDGQKLNQALSSWWQLAFPSVRSQFEKTLGAKIPVAERDEWENALAAWRANQRLDGTRDQKGGGAEEDRGPAWRLCASPKETLLTHLLAPGTPCERPCDFGIRGELWGMHFWSH